MGLEPCPLCIFQRIAVSAVGIVFPGRVRSTIRATSARAIYAGLGAGVSRAPARRSRHGRCGCRRCRRTRCRRAGMGLSYMMESMPLTGCREKVFAGSGECAEKGWEFLGLAIAGWTLVFFVAMIITAFALDPARITMREFAAAWRSSRRHANGAIQPDRPRRSASGCG